MSHFCPAVHWPSWSTGDAIWALPASCLLCSWKHPSLAPPCSALLFSALSSHRRPIILGQPASDTHWSHKSSKQVELLSGYLGQVALWEWDVSGKTTYCLQSMNRCCFCCRAVHKIITEREACWEVCGFVSRCKCLSAQYFHVKAYLLISTDLLIRCFLLQKHDIYKMVKTFILGSLPEFFFMI